MSGKSEQCHSQRAMGRWVGMKPVVVTQDRGATEFFAHTKKPRGYFVKPTKPRPMPSNVRLIKKDSTDKPKPEVKLPDPPDHFH